MTSNRNIFSAAKLVVAIALCEAVGLASGLLSRAGISDWFALLQKPSWNPPAFLFAPVWTFLYLLMGIALWLIWKSDAQKALKKNALLLFAVQLFLNFWWSIIFFVFHAPGIAFLEILLLSIAILITIYRFAPISRAAAWLLVPYISWVCFASILNYSICSLN